MMNRLSEAEQVASQALSIIGDAVTNFPDIKSLRHEQAASYFKVGEIVELQGRPTEAETNYHAAIRIYDELKQKSPTEWLYAQEDAFMHGALAGHLERMGRHEEAEAAFRRTIAILEKAAADFPDKTTFPMRLEGVRLDLADVLSNQGKDADAKALRETARSTSRTK